MIYIPSVFVRNICPILFALLLVVFITIEKYDRFTEWLFKHLQYLHELNFSYLETRTLGVFKSNNRHIQLQVTVYAGGPGVNG